MNTNKKVTTRIGIFETNSSSSHSISFGPLGRISDTLETDENGVIHVSTDDWEGAGNKFNDAASKLSYLLCFAYTLMDDSEDFAYDDLDSAEFSKKLKTEECYRRYREYLDFVKDIVLEFTGASDLVVFTERDTRIDHQSLDIINRNDFKDREFVKELVFNPNTWVYAIWDSYDPPMDFYENRGSILYSIVFDLPGISEEDSTLTFRFGDMSTLDGEISSFLYRFFWDKSKDKFYEISDPRYYPGNSGTYSGISPKNGKFTFGGRGGEDGRTIDFRIK